MNAKTDIRIELEGLSKAVSEIPVTQVFTVPSGYFEQFPAQMLDMVRALSTDAGQELAGLSPLLAGLSRKMPMTVPEGYFDAVKAPTGEAGEKVPAQVITIPRRRSGYFAMAAAVVAILGFGGLLYKMMGPSDPGKLDIAREMPKVSEKEMDEFLQVFPDVAVAETIVVAGNTEDTDDMLSDVDEAGLQDFLASQPDVKPHKLN